MDLSWKFWDFLVSACGGLRDGMAHELSRAEAKDWDLAILDAGHLVATQADKAPAGPALLWSGDGMASERKVPNWGFPQMGGTQ